MHLMMSSFISQVRISDGKVIKVYGLHNQNIKTENMPNNKSAVKVLRD